MDYGNSFKRFKSLMPKWLNRQQKEVVNVSESQEAEKPPWVVVNEFFVPKNGLALQTYLDLNDFTAVHHLVRYEWTIKVIGAASEPPRTVLDLGCGSGYGTYKLAHAFESTQIIGMDYDLAAIEHATAHHVLPNNRFIVADVCRWEQDIGPEKYDWITCFDVLEHVVHRELMMESLVKHLSKYGRCLMSTPLYRENHLAPEWDMHKIEYSFSSFRDFLSRYFRVIIEPEDDNFPFREVFQGCETLEVAYPYRMNPVIYYDPITFENS